MSDKHKQIGEILHAARIEQKRSLQEVSEETRIMVQHLESIEAGNPGNLPSTAYFMLFARNFAQFLGLDTTIFDEIANGDLTETASAGEMTPETKAQQAESVSQAQSGRFLKSLVTIIVIAILMFAAVLVYDRFFVTPTDSTNPETVELDSMITNTPEEIAPATETEVLQVPEYQPPTPLTLQLTVLQDVWAYISRDGEKIVDRELKIGDVYNWEAKHRFRFSLGISTAVEMVVNGTKLAPLTKTPRVISALEINQINYAEYFPVAINKDAVAETTEKSLADTISGGTDGD